MFSLLKAAVFGALLATAVFFFHFLIPLLLIAFLLGAVRRAWWGRRWAYAYAGHGACGGAHRWGPGAPRTPTIDGRDWQRPAASDTPARHVPIV